MNLPLQALPHSRLLHLRQTRRRQKRHLDLEAEIELIESSKLQGLDAQAAGGVFAEDEEDSGASDISEEEDSVVRKEVTKRMKKMAEDEEEEDED